MFPWQTPGTAHGAGLFPHAAASVFAVEVQNLQQQLEVDLEMGRGLKFETLQPQKR